MNFINKPIQTYPIMKSQTVLTIAIASLLFTACHTKEAQLADKPIEPAVRETPAAASTEATTPATDAVTSATSRPNTVSFNGVIVTAPQSVATVAVTMGGLFRQTNIVSGLYVVR